MIQLIKRIAKLVHLELNCIYDYFLFKKYYTPELKENKEFNKEGLTSWILQDKHRIEKAFSLPSPREGFGQLVLKRLAENLIKYREQYNKDYVYHIGVGAIKSYEKFHDELDKKTPKFYAEIKKAFDFDFDHPDSDKVGFESKDTKRDKYTSFTDFASSRKSCRNFDVEKTIKYVTEEKLNEIATIAKTTPSVCNRQHWRIHVFSGEKKNKVLSFQNGNVGFRENIPFVALITSDINAFYTVDERNQPFTDGGMFAMNFMYALHESNLSSCALNWCASFLTEKNFRKEKFIPDNERVVVAVAFGIANDNCNIAKSPRLPTNSFITINS